MEAIDINYQLGIKKVEQQEIARRAGVHPSTVCKAISGKIPGKSVWPVIIDILGFDPREKEAP